MKPAVLLAALLAWPSAAIVAAEGKPARPNVVIFLTDDESWLERSAYGWSSLPTPHFDRVALEGVLFTRGYTSAPSCAPSRASLLTGRNFWELEEGAFIQAHLPAKFPVLPDLMEAGGYFAGYTGKGYGPALLTGRTRNPAGDAYNSIKRKKPEEGTNPIDYVANFEKFLAAKPAAKPFWFWCGTTEPHAPYGKDNDKKLMESHGVGLEAVKVPGFLPDTPGVRRGRARFLYEVCHADRTLGGLLKALEDRGLLANTLLIVTSDNGTAVLRSKATSYDWGLHEPMAMMWPARVKGNRRVDDFVSFADLAPTILEATGLPVPAEMSGRSLLDVLLSGKSGRVDPSRGWVTGGLEWHGELPPANRASRMIRDERYQYIVNYSPAPRMELSPERRRPDTEYADTIEKSDVTDLVQKHSEHPAVRPFVDLLVHPPPREELYDCQEDPFELTNLADSPRHAETKAGLKAQLEAYQRKTGDPRVTGDMALFEKTRAFVEDRKRKGYKDE